MGQVLVWLKLARLDTLRTTFEQHEISGAVLLKFDEVQAGALITAHFSAQDKDDRDAKAETELTAKLLLAITELRKEAQRRQTNSTSVSAEGKAEAEADDESGSAAEAGGGTTSLSVVGRVQQCLFVCFQYALVFWIYKMLSNTWAKWKG